MSLIKCPECDHTVSSKAPFCPNCGVPIEGNVKRCPICGGFALLAADHCPHCDTKFVTDKQLSSSTEEQTVTKPIRPESPANVNNEESTRERGDNLNDKSAQPRESNTTPPPQQQDNPQQLIDPRAPKPPSHAPWYLLILAILLVGIGSFFYFENQNQEASEERAYEELRECNNPLNFEDFIARFPGSRHIDDVRAKLQELQREEALWITISHSTDASQFENFIASHPGSPYKNVAAHKIDSLHWREAEEIGTSAAYDAYIKRHDNGEYIDQAFQQRAAAQQREEQARRDSIAAAEARRNDSIAAAELAMPHDVIAPE